jgi:hypothetical protein
MAPEEETQGKAGPTREWLYVPGAIRAVQPNNTLQERRYSPLAAWISKRRRIPHKCLIVGELEFRKQRSMEAE